MNTERPKSENDVVEQVRKRFNRSEGQLRAVMKMIEEGQADPKTVISQLNAVISSLENAKIFLVEEYTKKKIFESINNLSDLLK
jgi:DNA-binding FrmR family transcriptional regulator